MYSHVYFPSLLADCGFDVLRRNVTKVDEPCVGPASSSAAAGAVDGGGGGKRKIFERIVSHPDLPFRKPSTPGELVEDRTDGKGGRV